MLIDSVSMKKMRRKDLLDALQLRNSPAIETRPLTANRNMHTMEVALISIFSGLPISGLYYGLQLRFRTRNTLESYSYVATTLNSSQGGTNNYKYKMLENTTPILAYQRLNEKMSNVSQLSAVPLNASVVYRQSLDQYPEYTYLREKLNSYTKKANKTPKIDQYQIRTYEKLFGLLYDLMGVDDKQLQIRQIRQIKKWLQGQEKIIKSRVKQGMQRFKVTKESRRSISMVDQLSLTNKQSSVKKPMIPSQIIQEALMPYARKWRTMHPGVELPVARLNHYERKKLDVQPPLIPQVITSQKYTILNKNISYSYIPHIPDSSTLERGEEDGKQAPTQIQPEQPSIANQDQLPQQIALPDDIPMFGQDPEEQEQSKGGGQDGDGDLAPQVKLYLSEAQIAPRRESYKTSFMYMKVKQSIQETRLELKFKSARGSEIMQKNQDSQMIQLVQKMAKDKSTLVKEQQKKLQLRASDPSYSLFEEQKREQFKLAQELESKYHLSQIKTDRKQRKIDLGFHLPKLNTTRASVNVQRSTEKPSLSILKKRFSHILNLSPENEQEQQQEAAPRSIAQYTGRTRAFSEMLYNTDKKSHREQEIQQLESVRQRLNAKKVGVNVRALVSGLCLPEDNPLEVEQMPEKSLLHNQFMAEAKKGKKKKKK